MTILLWQLSLPKTGLVPSILDVLAVENECSIVKIKSIKAENLRAGRWQIGAGNLTFTSTMKRKRGALVWRHSRYVTLRRDALVEREGCWLVRQRLKAIAVVLNYL